MTRSPLRTIALGIGFLCALGASVVIFVTDNPQYLRIGILVALWGFVFAALAASRRQAEQAVAATGEIELRKTYELELEREVAARREYELRLEALLRRELQEAFTAQVGGLRDELVRLRRELSEQWDSELRVERMVMRTQSVRMGPERLAGEQRGYERLESSSARRPTLDAESIDEDDGVEAAHEVEPEPVPPLVREPAVRDVPPPSVPAEQPTVRVPSRASGHEVPEPVAADPIPAPTRSRPEAAAPSPNTVSFPRVTGSETPDSRPGPPVPRPPAPESAPPESARPERAPAEPAAEPAPPESRGRHDGDPAAEDPAAGGERRRAAEPADEPYEAPAAPAGGRRHAGDADEDEGEGVNEILARILANAGVDAGGRRHRRRAEDDGPA